MANRELGTIESIGGDGRLHLKMDGGRAVELDPNRHPHLDYGYAVTSHSSQGQTADRVLIHVDTELGAKDLLNSRMAYVAVSRGAMTRRFSRTMQRRWARNSAATCPMRPRFSRSQSHRIEPQTTHTNQIGQGFGMGM